jgi:hypothetical protein
MERCSALYAEVQRSVGRLARVCERRKAQLEKHLPSPPAASNNKEHCDDDDVDDARIDNGNSVSACRQVGNNKDTFSSSTGRLYSSRSWRKKNGTLDSFISSGTFLRKVVRLPTETPKVRPQSFWEMNIHDEKRKQARWGVNLSTVDIGISLFLLLLLLSNC